LSSKTKTSDRELIALAARAAGIKPPASPYEGTIDTSGAFVYYDDCEGKTWHTWNPLINDRDAFRLAVHIGLIVNAPSVIGEVAEATFYEIKISEPVGSDRYAATRRAIVRAAAEIGRELP
jgi:hypothetical protein